VLLKEMQSLALDVDVISEEGGEVEIREEDDELLRAAEELGIDLSPGSLRAAAREPTAEETEEGQERMDVTGESELVLPSDETLTDITEMDADVTGGETPAEEAADLVGPFEEAPDLSELELEE
jgi:DNA-directed RNA polymerase subunit beta